MKWFMGRVRRVHFIGMGGIGMSGLAEIMLTLGFEVQGSDLRENQKLRQLREKGAKTFIGHEEKNVTGADVVVYSSAVPAGNAERRAARRLRIPEIRRAELLAELMRLRYGIAVAGTHGKTTTTSMIAHVLESGGLSPTVVIGGNANNIGTNARIGTGDFFVAEADESDESFLLLAPAVAVVTNIEAEHLDHYRDLAHIRETFQKFLHRVPFFGAAIVWGDDPVLRELVAHYPRRLITYGFHRESMLQGRIIRREACRQVFHVRYSGSDLGEFTVNIPGAHTVLNAMAAIAVALELGVDPGCIRQAIATFRGVKRRLDIKGETRGITVIDDYAHHPTEIRATLEAVRHAFPGKITAVFQPHRYTRTRFFMEDFAQVFREVDALLLLPVYAASEQKIEGATSHELMRRCLKLGTHTEMVDSIPEAVTHLVKYAKRGDIILTLGAGSVFKVSDAVWNALKRRGSPE